MTPPADQPRRAALSARTRTLIALGAAVLSAIILATLYRRATPANLLDLLRQLDPRHAATIAIAMAAILLLNGLRWRALNRLVVPVSRTVALREILAANALDPLVPLKAGAFTRAVFLLQRGASKSRAAGILLYEKISDLFGTSLVFLAAWGLHDARPAPALNLLAAACAAGLFGFLVLHLPAVHRLAVRLLPPASPLAARLQSITAFTAGAGRPAANHPLWQANACSVLLWLVQAFQFWAFFAFLRLPVPAADGITAMFAATLTGALPISFMGLGVRELTLATLLPDTLTHEAALLLGALGFLRIAFPATLGQCFLGTMIRAVAELRTLGPTPATPPGS